MKIASYNVNSIGARLPVLLHWLASSKPDVACLQELKTIDEKFPVEAIREAGLRIDHLLLSLELAPRLKAAGVDRDVRAMEKTSDHAPMWIELGS